MGMPNTRSRGAGIRNRVIGQYRDARKSASTSKDMKDHFPQRGASVPWNPPTRMRPGLGVVKTCAGCGRTQDLWEENNGEGISKGGRRYCCKPCSQGEACICADKDAQKGSELNSLWREASKPRRR